MDDFWLGYIQTGEESFLNLKDHVERQGLQLDKIEKDMEAIREQQNILIQNNAQLKQDNAEIGEMLANNEAKLEEVARLLAGQTSNISDEDKEAFLTEFYAIKARCQ